MLRTIEAKTHPERVRAAYLKYRELHPDRCREAKRMHSAACRARINALKEQPCADCGGCFPPECMDFDHVRGEKHKEIGAMFDHSPARLEAELAKCELVCANCHRIRTKARRHG